MTVSLFMSDFQYEVTHRTKGSHWCADCWHWVVDCVHLSRHFEFHNRLTPRDPYILSFAYDPAGRRLEIRYRWKSAAQFPADHAAMFRGFATEATVHACLNKWIKQRRVTWKEVRTERKIVASMVCGFRLVVERTNVTGPNSTLSANA